MTEQTYRTEQIGISYSNILFPVFRIFNPTHPPPSSLYIKLGIIHTIEPSEWVGDVYMKV